MYNLLWIFPREKLLWTYVHLSYSTKYYNWSWFSWSLIDCSLQRSVRESDGVKKMATLRYSNRFCFLYFFFSEIYTIDGGCVVLSAQLSEHVTIGQGRLNQSGIDTLRSFSRSGPRALHCGFVRDRKSISLPTYIHIFSTTYNTSVWERNWF